MISRKMITKILCAGTLKKVFSREKMASRKIFRHFLRANVFMFILLLCNHTVLLVQFGINLYFAEAARAISAI